MENIIFNGVVKYAYFGKSDNDTKDKTRILITVEDDNIEEIREKLTECYKTSSLKPKFVTEKSSNLMIKSLYDVPCRIDADMSQIKEDWTDYDTTAKGFVDMGYTIGAKVRVKIKLKNGAMYPVAIVVKELGTKYNPLEDM